MRLCDIISYDPAAGTFRWKIEGNKKVLGAEVGTQYKNGYNMITVNGVRYRAGRLAWFLSYNYWPREIDHINRIKSDDRLVNLREVSHSKNMTNVRTRAISGIRGIYWDINTWRWKVSLRREGITHRLGSYSSLGGAREALQTFLKSRGEI